jgi:hypothetical protein
MFGIGPMTDHHLSPELQMAQVHESRIGVTKITSGFGLRLWVAQRFTAAVTALFSSASFNRLRDNSGFVSGYRFSDTVSPSELDAPLGAGQRESTFPQPVKPWPSAIRGMPKGMP